MVPISIPRGLLLDQALLGGLVQDLWNRWSLMAGSRSICEAFAEKTSVCLPLEVCCLPTGNFELTKHLVSSSQLPGRFTFGIRKLRA